MSNSEAENIIEDIKKSGLPCEIETTIVLQSHGWIVRNQSAYLDEDSEKLRHIDLIATKYVKKYAIINLIVECSKSEKPWAFYGNWNKNNASNLLFVYPAYFPIEALSIADLTHQKKEDIFKGIIPYQPFKNGQSVDIFDASMKAIKALEYQAVKQEKWEQDLNRNFPNIFYPIVVFDGHLYSLNVIEGEILPKIENYLTYQFEYKTRYHLIDVVNRQNLNEFCDLLENEIKQIEKLFDKYHLH